MAQYTGKQNPVPDYGPGSINRAAKKRLAAIPDAVEKGVKTSLLNAINGASSGPMNQSSAAIQERIRQKKATAGDTGQSR